MSKKQEYLQRCKDYLQEVANNKEYTPIMEGVYYKILQPANSSKIPTLENVVTVHYKGQLITGKIFDNSYQRGCPEALRISDTIIGWQMALTKMRIGEKWQVIIAAEHGYGKRSYDSIPGGSVLIFEIELINIC